MREMCRRECVKIAEKNNFPHADIALKENIKLKSTQNRINKGKKFQRNDSDSSDKVSSVLNAEDSAVGCCVSSLHTTVL